MNRGCEFVDSFDSFSHDGIICSCVFFKVAKLWLSDEFLFKFLSNCVQSYFCATPKICKRFALCRILVRFGVGSGTILAMGLANERRRYNVTSPHWPSSCPECSLWFVFHIVHVCFIDKIDSIVWLRWSRWSNLILYWPMHHINKLALIHQLKQHKIKRNGLSFCVICT